MAKKQAKQALGATVVFSRIYHNGEIHVTIEKWNESMEDAYAIRVFPNGLVKVERFDGEKFVEKGQLKTGTKGSS